MSVEPKVKMVEGLGQVSSVPLPPMRALDLLPEVADLMEKGVRAGNDVAMFAAIMKALGGGKLRELLPRLLAGTKVKILEGGTNLTVSLTDTDSIDITFDGRMGALPEVVALAVEVSFKDFLSGLARIAGKLKVEKAPTASPDPSP